MKLRNKHTGEVKEFNEIFLTKVNKETNTVTSEYVERSYCSVDELTTDWEDYKPVEPLIKDEKICKAVRAWAGANGVKWVRIVGVGTLRCEHAGVDIDFDGAPFVGWVTELKTITELCGEEEE